MYLDQINIIYYCLYNSNEKQETKCDQTMYDDPMRMLNVSTYVCGQFPKVAIQAQKWLSCVLNVLKFTCNTILRILK